MHEEMKCGTKAKPSKVGKKNLITKKQDPYTNCTFDPQLYNKQPPRLINLLLILCVSLGSPPQYPNPWSQSLKRRKDNILGKQWSQASEGLFWEYGGIKTLKSDAFSWKDCFSKMEDF